MIDTIRVRIKAISPSDMAIVRSKLSDHLVVDNETGSQKTIITKGSLLGSYDYRVQVQEKSSEWVSGAAVNNWKHGVLRTLISDLKNTPVLVPCPPYLEIEFSLPKWAYGGNFFNVSLIDDIRNFMRFRKWLCVALGGVHLPELHMWEVLRLDTAINYDFVDCATVREYIEIWRGLDYPRRKKPTFYADSLYIPGSTTTLKLYSKLPEWRKHDKQRLTYFLQQKYKTVDNIVKAQVKEKIELIEKYIDGVLRFEVEWHKRKLLQLNIYSIEDIFKINWMAEMKIELEKMIGNAPETSIFTLKDVSNKLDFAHKNGYLKGKISKPAVLSIWTTIVVNGRTEAIRQFGRQQVWRGSKVLRSLNIGFTSNLMQKDIQEKLNKCNILQFVIKGTDGLRHYHRILGRTSVKTYQNLKAVNE